MFEGSISSHRNVKDGEVSSQSFSKVPGAPSFAIEYIVQKEAVRDVALCDAV